LNVRAGEIVSLSGLVGAGRSETANCIFGADAYDSGEVLIGGKPVPARGPAAAIESGIALIPEDRRHQALVGKLSVLSNATLAVARENRPFGLISRDREDRVCERRPDPCPSRWPRPTC
jgi:ABC-type sugar transport system ATPase subunit